MSSNKPQRPRFVPQLILTSTTLAGLAVVPAVTINCGGKTTDQFSVGSGFVDAGQRDASQYGVGLPGVSAAFDAAGFSVAATFDSGGLTVAASFDAGFGVAATFDGGGFTVAATFDGGGFTVAAALDSGDEFDAFGFTVAAIQDSGGPPDASGFTVAANIDGSDDSGQG